MDIQIQQQNQTRNKKLADELLERIRKISQGGDIKQRERHVDRGKLLVRDRIDRLVDFNTPFLELSSLAAYNQYNNEIP